MSLQKEKIWTQTQREDDVETQGESSCVQSKDTVLKQVLPWQPSEEAISADTMILDFQPPE